MEIKMIVGQNIKFYRFERNMTQEELSAKAKLSTNAISSIENGKADIKLSNLFEIATALCVDIRDLLDTKAKVIQKWRVDLKGK